MGRHSSGKNNYSLSGGAIAALIGLIALISLLIWFFALRPDHVQEVAQGDKQDEKQCVAGDLELPVSASDEAVAKQLIDAYAASHPVVRDHCVNPVYTPDLAASAVHVSPENPVTKQELEQAKRSAATSDAAPVAAQEVGLAGAKTAPESGADLASVSFPVEEQSAASAVAATKLAGSEDEAIAALTDQRIAAVADIAGDENRFAATVKDRVPEGMQFSPLGASVVYSALPLNQTDAVNEEQARAGQDFAKFSAEKFSGDAAAQPQVSETVWAAATPSGGAEESKSAEGADGAKEEKNPEQTVAAENTLFLLDTSDAMTPFKDAAADAIGDTARGLAGQGKTVGLWNYSSPLNPGVTRGYRENLNLTPDAEAVAGAAGRLGTGGQPQTREALSAAVGYAAQLDTPTRIVLVTTGTADAANDDAFLSQLRETGGDKVSISVVHVGEGIEDAAAKEAAAHHATAPTADAIKPATAAAAGV